MAFGAKKDTGNARNVNTSDQSILANDVVIKGEVLCEGLLRIEGKVEGAIKGNGEITVAENADLKADIEGRKVIILGKVEGNIKATNSVELVSTAKVFGDITTDKISIEEGAVFTGKCVTKAPEKPKFEEPSTAQSKKDSKNSAAK